MALIYAAKSLVVLGRSDDALKYIEKIQEMRPNDPETLKEVGKYYYQLDRLEEASEL